MTHKLVRSLQSHIGRFEIVCSLVKLQRTRNRQIDQPLRREFDRVHGGSSVEMIGKVIIFFNHMGQSKVPFVILNICKDWVEGDSDDLCNYK